MTPDSSHNELQSAVEFVPFRNEETEQSIPACFEERANRYPERIAVKTRTRCLTYRELNTESNRIARAVLAATGNGPIALLIGDDASTVTGMLAVLKAGRMFVPLDAAQPDARSAWVLEDSQAGLLVTDSRHLSRARALAASSDLGVLDLDAIDEGFSGDGLDLPLSPDTLAYMLYTSGSTGRPKGVLQNHRNVLHNIYWHTNSLRISPRDRLTLLSNRSTGQAMTGVFSALLNGAALHPFDLRRDGLAGLATWLVEDGITIYHSSATVFRQFAGGLTGELRFPALRVVKLGSESVSKGDVESFKKCFPRGCIFVNALSSTETGTIRQTLIDHDTTIAGDTVPVGYPVPDIEVLLLDDGGEPVAPGEVGDISVRSRYLSPGYWRSPEFTRAAFVPDRDDVDVRLFRTGDLGRMAPDGSLECVGRKDFRVKIRGNRVDVAEVELALLETEWVRQAAVVGQDDGRGGNRLVAYVVPGEGAVVPGTPAARRQLSAKLPSHMVPTAFVFLEALPLTPSGKVDRRALPHWQPPDRGPNVQAPRDFLETEIATIWEDLLGVSNIGIGDDFFELGGDSLLAVEMTIRVEQACGARISLQNFLPELTIEKIAKALVDQKSGSYHAPLVEVQSGGASRPLFFAHGDYETGGFYCRNLARLLGANQPFYALHPHGLDGKPVPRTIEEMAADRLNALLSFQPNGPYLLGGFCAGGTVAFEMAQQLRKRGERVDLLLLIDARAQNARFRSASKFVNGVAWLFRLGPGTRGRLFRRLRRFLTALQDASRRGIPDVIVFVLKKPYSVTRGALQGTAGAGPNQRPTPLNEWQLLWQAHHEALEDYVPEPYPGRLVLLRSAHLDLMAPGDPVAGWQHVSADVVVQPIPGNHKTCVTRYVGELAAKMSAHLRAGG